MSEDIFIEPLSIEQLAAQDKTVEDKIHYYRDVWWRQVRLFFYEPVHILSELKPLMFHPHPLKSLIGYRHIVPNGCFSNTSICFMMLDSKKYSHRYLSASKRSKIRRAAKQIEVKQINDINDLLNDGFETYISFFNRTNWGRNMTDYNVFKSWIERRYLVTKRIELGAYFNNKLIAFAFGHAMENTAYLSYTASHSDYLKFYPNDALVHAFLEICGGSDPINKVIFGLKSLKESLNKFKIGAGFREVTYPGYVKLNPFAHLAAKTFNKIQYKRLMGKI